MTLKDRFKPYVQIGKGEFTESVENMNAAACERICLEECKKDAIAFHNFIEDKFEVIDRGEHKGKYYEKIDHLMMFGNKYTTEDLYSQYLKEKGR